MNTFQWPNHVAKASERGDIVLFIGAGVSKGSQLEYDNKNYQPPSWDELLKAIEECLGVAGSDSNIADYLEKAEYLYHFANEKGRIGDILSLIKEKVDSPIPKINRQQFPPNEWHEAITRLEPRIVVTTNYDEIFEREFHYFTTYLPTRDVEISELENAIRSKDAILLKIHGTCQKPDTMVLTQKDYIRNMIENPSYFDLIRSLLRTKTFVFIGYSMNDPDLKMVLQNTMIPGCSKQPKHYMLSYGFPEWRSKMLLDSYGIKVLDYKPYTSHISEGAKILASLPGHIDSVTLP